MKRKYHPNLTQLKGVRPKKEGEMIKNLHCPTSRCTKRHASVTARFTRGGALGDNPRLVWFWTAPCNDKILREVMGKINSHFNRR